jgi:hypothetical protein
MDGVVLITDFCDDLPSLAAEVEIVFLPFDVDADFILSFAAFPLAMEDLLVATFDGRSPPVAVGACSGMLPKDEVFGLSDASGKSLLESFFLNSIKL